MEKNVLKINRNQLVNCEKIFRKNFSIAVFYRFPIRISPIFLANPNHKKQEYSNSICRNICPIRGLCVCVYVSIVRCQTNISVKTWTLEFIEWFFIFFLIFFTRLAKIIENKKKEKEMEIFNFSLSLPHYHSNWNIMQPLKIYRE